MKKLHVLCFIISIILYNCGSGGSDTHNNINRGEVYEFTGIGDSTMAGVGIKDGKIIQVFSWQKYLNPFQNEGINGASIEYWLSFPDTRQLNKVILSIGFNNVKKNQTIEEITYLFSQLFLTIRAQKIYVIGIFPMDHSLSDIWYPDGAWITNERIQQINNNVKALTETHGYFYIDTFILFFDPITGQAKKNKSFDGIHPSTEAYEDIIVELIKKEILN